MPLLYQVWSNGAGDKDKSWMDETRSRHRCFGLTGARSHDKAVGGPTHYAGSISMALTQFCRNSLSLAPWGSTMVNHMFDKMVITRFNGYFQSSVHDMNRSIHLLSSHNLHFTIPTYVMFMWQSDQAWQMEWMCRSWKFCISCIIICISMTTSWHGNAFCFFGSLWSGIRSSPLDSPHNGPVMWNVSLLLAWIICWINSKVGGDSRRQNPVMNYCIKISVANS